MGSIPQSPSIKTVSSHRERDTGFPEPFCGHGNTSLPHPEARTGPNACITADDIPVSRTRERRSFLGSNKYHKRITSHGRLTPQQQQSIMRQQNEGTSTLYNDSVLLDSDADSPTLSPTPFMPSRTGSFAIQPSRQSKDSYDERNSSSAHGPNDGRSSMMGPPDSPLSTSTSRSRGIFRRLRWNRG